MDLGPPFEIFVLAMFASPALGFIVGTKSGKRSVFRGELVLLLGLYAWGVGWFIIALLSPQSDLYYVAEHFNCATLLAFPLVGVWFAVRGIQHARARSRNAAHICPRCGYDLRGQRAEVRDQRSDVSGIRAGCPECGWNREDSKNC